VEESTNKNLIGVLKKIVTEHQKNWNNALPNALWDDRVTPNVSLDNSPFFLVYGKETILPPNVFLPSLQLAQSSNEYVCLVMQRKINTLLKLEDEREKIKHEFHECKKLLKCWFDKHFVNNKDFHVGLKWNKIRELKGKHTKFQHLWLGPFHIFEKIGPVTFILKTLAGEIDKLPANGQI
jgi:hypothetical protein